MGYHITLRDHDFHIDKDAKPDALAAIKDLMNDPDAERSGGTAIDTGLSEADLDDLPDDYTFEASYGTYTLAEIQDLPHVHLSSEGRYVSYDTVHLHERWFSWMNNAVPAEWETLEDAMDEWGYPIKTDDEGNVVGIQFVGQKIGDEDQLFDAIAPHVDGGSYIEMSGEDGHIWRWVFEGDSAEEVEGEVTF